MVEYLDDAEERMGIEPVNRLLARRWDLVNKSADLAARHGKGGTWQDIRKSEVSRIKALTRAQAGRDKRRVTEAQLDDEAHSSQEYLDLLAEATTQRAEWLRTEAKIQAIDTKIMRDQAVARFVTQEARL